MAPCGHCEREDDSPRGAVDTPSERDELRRRDDHAGDDNDSNRERHPEALEDLGHLLEEVRALHLLLRRRPGHVVREQVREDGLAEMDAQATEEEEAVEERVSDF